MDRFQVVIRFPNGPSNIYFQQKYGSKGKHICEWWKKLPKDIQTAITPRRLEYVLQTHLNDGEIKFLLPKNSQADTLANILKDGTYEDQFDALWQKRETAPQEVSKWLNSKSNFGYIKDYLTSTNILPEAFDYLNTEYQSNLISMTSIKERISRNFDKYAPLVESIVNANKTTSRPTPDVRWAMEEYKKYQQALKHKASTDGLSRTATSSLHSNSQVIYDKLVADKVLMDSIVQVARASSKDKLGIDTELNDKTPVVERSFNIISTNPSALQKGLLISYTEKAVTNFIKEFVKTKSFSIKELEHLCDIANYLCSNSQYGKLTTAMPLMSLALFGVCVFGEKALTEYPHMFLPAYKHGHI
jgi:hypothetical protein